jgi:hypothetical protein
VSAIARKRFLSELQSFADSWHREQGNNRCPEEVKAKVFSEIYFKMQAEVIQNSLCACIAIVQIKL